jgi:putative methionine-R-sulfoxide reductase with GAF domain
VTGFSNQLSADSDQRAGLRLWRAHLLDVLLRGITALGFLLLAAAGANHLPAGRVGVFALFAATYAALLVITVFRRIPYTLRAIAFVALPYALGLMEALGEGLAGDTSIFLLSFVMMSATLLGTWAGISALVLSATTLGVVGWAGLVGRLTFSSPSDLSQPAGWVSSGLALVVLSTIIIIAQRLLTEAQSRALATGRENEVLQEMQVRLEEQTRELEAGNTTLVTRTAELEAANARLEGVLQKSEHRSGLLQASAEVSRAVTEIRDRDELLSRVTELISDRFGYYHVGIFLIDDSGFNAVLRASNSPGGQRMLARGHRLAVGMSGIVGFVTGAGRSRVARDVGYDAHYLNNPDLPETRSELALPLRVAGRVIGALDVQSVEPDAFEPEDVSVLAALADQIAVAIENTRLLQQSQIALQEARAAQRRTIRQEWDAFVGYQPYEERPLPVDNRPPERGGTGTRTGPETGVI